MADRPDREGDEHDGCAPIFADAHSKPFFDLSVEPWIPVIYKDGSLSRVGLRALLIDSPNILDIGEEDPVVRAALRRYLSAQVAQLMRLTGLTAASDWLGRLRGSDLGFTDNEVDTLLENQNPYLYLYHPETPFLQDMQLLNGKMQPISTYELVPHLPGASEAAWFDKKGDPSMSEGMSLADAARYLTAAWFYTFVGNSGGGSKGSLGATVGTTTNVFRVDTQVGLFATLLRNITPSSLVTEVRGAISGPAWMTPQPPRPFGDGLYESTVTATGLLLGPVSSDVATASVSEFVKGTTLANSNKEEVSQVLKGARDNDPHRFWVTNDKGERERFIQEPDPHLSPIIVRLGRKPLASFGVASPNGLAITGYQSATEQYEFLLGKSQGMAASAKWLTAETQIVPAAFADTTHPQAKKVLRSFGQTIQKCDDSLNRACKSAFTKSDGKQEVALAQAALEKARSRFYVEVDAIVAAALFAPTPPSPRDIQAAVMRGAESSLADALSTYSTTSRWAASIAQAMGKFPKSKGHSNGKP
jgi:hypothetical protein